MSLTAEGFMQAYNERKEMRERLTRLLGFDPAYSDHYGTIRIYNREIDSRTTDEEILEIRQKYVKWRTDILAFLKERGYTPEGDAFSRLFDIDGMFGTMSFLGVYLNIDKGIEKYVPKMLEFLETREK